LSSFEEKQEELSNLGVSIYAATVDSEEQSKEVAESGIRFPLGYGVTRDIGERLGAWWDERRDCIQPSEFLISGDGRILSSTYSSSPIGRLDPGDVITLLNFIEARRKQRAAEDRS
jgi:peroxiredoxin